MARGRSQTRNPEGQESLTYGELWVRNPGLAPCYYGLSEVNRDRLKDGWLKTGDVFERDSPRCFSQAKSAPRINSHATPVQFATGMAVAYRSLRNRRRCDLCRFWDYAK
jgi:acyl-CoA synthetase (AMP-forming)/AMP-acid ligase II